jgi:transposase-like protein
MDTNTNEQSLRREAIRRRLPGERRVDICRALDRSPGWFSKWWRAYRADPGIDLADRSRVPHTSPQQLPAAVVQAIITARQTLEAAKTPDTRYGLIGHRAVQSRLRALQVKPLPSLASIQRVMRLEGLTHALGAGEASAYYPWPVPWAVNAIQATDIITRYVRGGQAIENFHSIDLYSYAAALSQHADATSATARQHLLQAWAFLGLPAVQQFDNEGAFSGGHTHARVIGQVVRLCLFCGIEPFFTPVYEAKRNYQAENFHLIWVGGFWSRGTFTGLPHVQIEAPLFGRWYHHHYRPPALDGRTPAEMRRGQCIHKLSGTLRDLIPTGRLPITRGRLHSMRKVNSAGDIHLLNDRWSVGRRWLGEYVRATINTVTQQLTTWHQADEQAAWRRLTTRAFRLKEPVHDLLPEFRRRCPRCLEHWPD